MWENITRKSFLYCRRSGLTYFCNGSSAEYVLCLEIGSLIDVNGDFMCECPSRQDRHYVFVCVFVFVCV